MDNTTGSVAYKCNKTTDGWSADKSACWGFTKQGAKGIIRRLTERDKLNRYAYSLEPVNADIAHSECTTLSYDEYQKRKTELCRNAKAYCKEHGYWGACVAVKRRGSYLVNLQQGYLFVANSYDDYVDKLSTWDSEDALVITAYNRK
jgi:hypothetical protein